jgi:hypothetical protein
MRRSQSAIGTRPERSKSTAQDFRPAPEISWMQALKGWDKQLIQIHFCITHVTDSMSSTLHSQLSVSPILSEYLPMIFLSFLAEPSRQKCHEEPSLM